MIFNIKSYLYIIYLDPGVISKYYENTSNFLEHLLMSGSDPSE